MTITDFCEELHNFFEQEKYIESVTIENGVLLGFSDRLHENQYFRIVGSVFNDGVYKYPTTDLTDETFDGAIWAMAVPPAALALLEKIQEWDEKYSADEVANSPYQSESFGGYSYTKVSNSAASGGGSAVSWQNQFKSQLNRWRKI
jgi:hypothetical protein